MDISILFKGLVKRDGEWSEVASKLQQVKNQIKTLELLEKEYAEALKVLSDGVGSHDDLGNTYKPYEVSGRIDYKKIPQLQNLDLEPYRGASSTNWKMGFIVMPKE